jgi:hypothetical protein
LNGLFQPASVALQLFFALGGILQEFEKLLLCSLLRLSHPIEDSETESEVRRMKELEQYFKALGDANRLRILNLLLHGELCVCDIQFVLAASQPNVSRHLAYLKNSGLVIDRRD